LRSKVVSAAVAVFLLLCILLGGSAQGVWGNLALQLLGIALLAYAAMSSRPDNSTTSTRLLFILLLLGLLAVLVQLVPLPPGLWTILPGRAPIAAGVKSLGYPLPWMPISLTPFASVMTLATAIPAIAALAAVAFLRPEPRWIAMSVVSGTVLAILLGAIQVANGSGSWAYLYRNTSPGAVGFFANQNHMATLLLVAIPMAAALFSSAKGDRRSSTGRYAVGAVFVIMLLIGIALNRSLAAWALVIPVLIASVSVLPAAINWRRFVLPIAAAALLGAVVVVATHPIGGGSVAGSASVSSREAIWHVTAKAVGDTFPVGTGLGSFQQYYGLYEQPAQVTAEYINHAHNDYLELVLELGAAGVLLLVLFLAWWFVTAIRIWRSPYSGPAVRSATIATAAILAHSAVDFPLRTAAISAIFGALLALMALPLQATAATKGEARPRRHVHLG
jgi:O-antigen ligase